MPDNRVPVDMGYHDGYVGMFTRNQAAGAIPNGSTIRKRNSEPGDANPNGALGVVLGSIDAREFDLPAQFAGVTYCYFIEWHAYPRKAVGTTDIKVESAT